MIRWLFMVGPLAVVEVMVDHELSKRKEAQFNGIAFDAPAAFRLDGFLYFLKIVFNFQVFILGKVRDFDSKFSLHLGLKRQVPSYFLKAVSQPKTFACAGSFKGYRNKYQRCLPGFLAR